MRLGGVWTHAPPILTLTPMTLSLSFVPVSLPLSDVPLSRVPRSLSHSPFFFLSPCHSLSSASLDSSDDSLCDTSCRWQMTSPTPGDNRNSRSPPELVVSHPCRNFGMGGAQTKHQGHRINRMKGTSKRDDET